MIQTNIFDFRIKVECVSARNSEGEEVSNTPEAKNLLKYFDSPKNERKVEDLNLQPGWTKFRFRLCQKACSVPDRGANVTLLHLVILHQDVVMLQHLIKEITEEDLEKGYLKEKIKYRMIPHDFLVEDDRWLFDANCLHLATKYFPEGLNLLLCEDKVKNKAKELINTKTKANTKRLDSTISHEASTQNKGCFPFCRPKEIHPEAQTKEIVEIAPLHIAAKKPDSISTR